MCSSSSGMDVRCPPFSRAQDSAVGFESKSNYMARIALLDGSDCQLNDHETAIVQGIGRRFKDWSDFHEALAANEPRCYSGIKPSMRQVLEVRAQVVVGNGRFRALV